MTDPWTYRIAVDEDAPILAGLNQKLIRDEGHRNPMNLEQLTERMTGWLQSEYQAVLFEQDRSAIGYGLFRRDPEFIYLRQFFVVREFRRQGVGRAAMNWLWQNSWQDAKRLRLEVLVNNDRAIAFWRAVGFKDYCITMEVESPAERNQPPAK